MSKISDEGKQRLLAVKEKILVEPQLFDMCDFDIQRDCGTVCCICGWINLLQDGKSCDYANTIRARTLLGLDPRDFDSTNSIFYADDWPEPFRSQYDEVRDEPDKRVGVAAAYIDYLVKGGEF